MNEHDETRLRHMLEEAQKARRFCAGQREMILTLTICLLMRL
jgi:hypothetical protein